LFIGAALFAQWGVFPRVLPDPIGPVPLAIPWLGALGAVTIGLYGFFTHQQAWDNAYEYWHVARPVTGAILGVLAYFIFVAVVNAATATAQQPAPTGAGATPQGRFVYYIVAFLVGYREQTFQALVQRVTDLLFTPVEGTKATPAAEPVGVRPQTADAGHGS
jgi:hypothetical protein